MISKKDFPLFNLQPNLAYFDAAATSQKPAFVFDTINNWYSQNNANPRRGEYDLSYQAGELLEKARKEILSVFSADGYDLIFVPNATNGINLLANGLVEKIGPNENIVISELEHHSNFLPWKVVCDKSNSEIRLIKQTAGYLDLESARSLIDQHTALVSLTHVSNVYGTIQPLNELIKIAHSNNSLVIVDGTQAVPHFISDLTELNADAYVFSGHKAYAPFGSGAVILKKSLAKLLKPLIYGGEMVKQVDEKNFILSDSPQKFEGGTIDPVAQIAMSEAINYLAKIQDQNREFDKQMANKIYLIAKSANATLINTQAPDIPLISFKFKDLHPHDVVGFLNEKHIAVRSGFMCAEPLVINISENGLTRISAGLWNDDNDLVKLEKTLKELDKI